MTGTTKDRTMEMIGRSTASYLARTPCVPLFMLVFKRRSGNKGACRLPGATWDHFRCTVEPSPARDALHLLKSSSTSWLSSHLFVRILFSFACPCPPHPSPGNYLSPRSPLSGTSDLLFLVKKRQPAWGLGFGDGSGGGSPHKEKKGKSFSYGAWKEGGSLLAPCRQTDIDESGNQFPPADIDVHFQHYHLRTSKCGIGIYIPNYACQKQRAI